MKTRVYIAILAAGALLFLAGRMTARSGSSLSQKTQENLSTAMHGEAFAFAKYMLYAKHAEQNGNKDNAGIGSRSNGGLYVALDKTIDACGARGSGC
jgi:hypothetical protein